MSLVDNPETVGKWTVDRTSTGVVVTIVHAGSWRSFLSSKSQETHLALTIRQAEQLIAELGETISSRVSDEPW